MATRATMLSSRRAFVRSCPRVGTRRTERMSPANDGGVGCPPSPEVGPASAGFVTTEAGLYSSGSAAPASGPGTLAPRAEAHRGPSPRPGNGAPAPRRAPARTRVDPRVVHRQGRRLRPHLPRHRDVRVHTGPPVRVHPAAVRLVPHPPLLDLRPPLAGRRSRTHRRCLRDDPGRLADRPALADAGDRTARGA